MSGGEEPTSTPRKKRPHALLDGHLFGDPWFRAFVIWAMFALPLSLISMFVLVTHAKAPAAVVWGVPLQAVKPYLSTAMAVSLVAQVVITVWGLRHAVVRKRLVAQGKICPVCAYDLSAVTAPICPECGKAITRPASTAAQSTESKPSPPPTDAPH